MELYNCDTELEKELKGTDLSTLDTDEKGLLAVRVYRAYRQKQIKDANKVISALEQIALSLVPVPQTPIEVIDDNKKILLSHPVPEDNKEIVLALWGGMYVTWYFFRESQEFNLGHYYHVDDYGSPTAAYLMAVQDYKERISNKGGGVEAAG